MTRREIYSDMEETLGLAPSFFKIVPDSTLEQDWTTFKRRPSSGATGAMIRETR